MLQMDYCQIHPKMGLPQVKMRLNEESGDLLVRDLLLLLLFTYALLLVPASLNRAFQSAKEHPQLRHSAKPAPYDV